MADKFNILDYTSGPRLRTGQTTDYTPAGRTTKDDGSFQRGIVSSKLDAQYEILTLDQYSGTTDIIVNAKTDTHSNACVFDKVTSLMWSRTLSANVFGGAGNGGLLWDDSGGSNEDIFKYCDQANLAGLAGFSDWRIPNLTELFSLTLIEATSGVPNATAFPVGFPGAQVWSSTTRPDATANGTYVFFGSGQITATSKLFSRIFALLVRSGHV